MPTDDPLFEKAIVDGPSGVPDEVKKPSESKYPWDYYKVRARSRDQAFRPLAEEAVVEVTLHYLSRRYAWRFDERSARRITARVQGRLVAPLNASFHCGWFCGIRASRPGWVNGALGSAIGLINGAMLSLGLAVIFGLLNIINFTHGAQYMMGAFCAWFLLNKAGVGYWWALLLAPIVVGAIGMLIERTMLARLYKLDHLYGLLLTFGLALLIQGVFRNELARQLRTRSHRSLPAA
jgi:hypothetical protein